MYLLAEERNILPLLVQIISNQDASSGAPIASDVEEARGKEESSYGYNSGIRFKFAAPPSHPLEREVFNAKENPCSIEKSFEKLKKLKKTKTSGFDFKKISIELLCETLCDLLPTLSERERHILLSRYSERCHRALRDLAKEYSISHERIRQIEQNALKKLRQAFEAKLSDK